MKIKSTKPHPKGFTLVEMMVVVAIVLLLASIGGTAMFQMRNAAKKQQNQATLKQLETSIQDYFLDFNEFPQASNGSGENSDVLFQTLFEGASPDGTAFSGNGKSTVYAEYLDPDINNGLIDENGDIVDPFGEPYRYLDRASNSATNNPDFDLWSSGKNMEDEYSSESGGDDAKNW